MKIVKPTSATTTLKIIPREDVKYIAVIIRDEATKKVVSQNVYLASKVSNYLKFDVEFDFEENQSYNFDVFRISGEEYLEENQARVEGDGGEYYTSDCLYKFYYDLYGKIENLIYRDKIFCTSQDVSKYNMNAERFVQANKTATTYKF